MMNIKVVFIILLTIFICSCEKKKVKFIPGDLYLQKNQVFETKIKSDSIKKVIITELYNDSIVTKMVLIPNEYLKNNKGIIYFEKIKETSICIGNANLHHSYKIEIETIDNHIYKHLFSDFVVTQYEANPFNYFSVSYYIYNGKEFRDENCNFDLNDSLYFASKKK